MKDWDSLPSKLKNDKVFPYYKNLKNKILSLKIKFFFDKFISLLLIILLVPLFIIVAIFIKIDSRGPVIFKQIRVTTYLKKFTIYKFRTMYINSDLNNKLITTQNDKRVTKVGKVLRKLKIDELPQLFNVFRGEMTIVGARPEVVKYVNEYSDEMLATLLLPAGITSFASVMYHNENDMLNLENLDKSYLNDILPHKMKFNLEYLKKISFCTDIFVIYKTVITVLFRR